MKTKYTLLFVIIYMGILSPLISYGVPFLLNLLDFNNPSIYLNFNLFSGIPYWFIPLVLTFTIEKGGVKIAAFIISGLYILYQLGLVIFISTQ